MSKCPYCGVSNNRTDAKVWEMCHRCRQKEHPVDSRVRELFSIVSTRCDPNNYCAPTQIVEFGTSEFEDLRAHMLKLWPELTEDDDERS